MTGVYSLGPQPGQAHNINIGGDSSKPRVVFIRSDAAARSLAGQWRTISMVPGADNVSHSIEDVCKALRWREDSPYQAITDKCIAGLRRLEGEVVARKILHDYESMRTDLR